MTGLQRRRVSRCRGQATVETVLMMTFLLMVIYGIIQFSLLFATKYMVDYAAFTGARALMVGGNCEAAARAVIADISWWRNSTQAHVFPRCDKTVDKTVVVSYEVPFGFPIYRSRDGVIIESTASVPRAE